MSTVQAPEADSPAARAEARRQASYDEARLRASTVLQVLTLAEAEGMDAPCFGTTWFLADITITQALGTDATPEAKRDFALAWLRRHATGIRAIVRSLGQEAKVTKTGTDTAYGVRGDILVDHVTLLRLSADVEAATTCEMVPTGEVEEVPAVPATTRPVMRKVCPPSIYANLADGLADDPESTPTPTTPES